MKLHHIISYSLMTTGLIAAATSLLKRRRWEQTNTRAAIMLDWDDVQAVATRALSGSPEAREVVALLHRFKENGATHLSIPELTLERLLQKGELSITQGASPARVYLQAKNAALADLVTMELQARLPYIDARRSKAKKPVISFRGDLPAVAEVGLGFDPAHAELARQGRLSPVARPIGYSWVQPEMIERTLDQAARLDAKIVAVQGTLIPGHEFKIQHTVEAMRRNQLTYAYFRESRHQKGDWFLAKHLAPSGLVILAHEFELSELLDEDWFTASYRWANLAVEAGVRLCSVRFFRILHAADPMESLAYVKELSQALRRAGFSTASAEPVDLTPVQPEQAAPALACVGLSAAGAAGLASDLLPLSDRLKIMGVTAGAVLLAGLPFLEKARSHRHHSHNQNHDHHNHHDHGHHHDRHHHDHHDHNHDHNHGHSHSPALATAYAQKGLALAAAVAYPAAATAIDGTGPLVASAHALAIDIAGAMATGTATVDRDYLMGIEEYRGYNLDWLLPLGLAASTALTGPRRGFWQWVPLAGVALAALRTAGEQSTPDLLATFDREHRHTHTHHLSAFQQQLGDLKLAFSPRPLRKWALLAPLGTVSAAIFKRNGQDELATAALMAATAGHVATLTGFRHGQRPLDKTLAGRARGWAIGALLGGLVWLVASFFGKKNRR